ncbi:hypothetical protein K439DRAFT_1620336 [Ramaria rubella]|nr:hypothetical protein K439DRAFT_1620336 [Ramaria rubella]
MSGATAKGPDRRVEPAHDVDRQTGMPTRVTSPHIIMTPVASDSRSQKRELADQRRSAQDESETDNISSVKKTKRTSTRLKLRSSLDESRELLMSNTDESPGTAKFIIPIRDDGEKRITTLKESRKHIETTHEVSQRVAEAACAADDAVNQLQTLGDGMELLIQSLEEEVQGPLRGKAPEHGNNPNRDREVDREAEKARRRRDRQRMPPLAGPSTRSGPREPSATREKDSDSTRRRTEEETDPELDARDRGNIRKGIRRSKKTYNEQEVLKAVTQQSLWEMMKSDADSISTMTSTHGVSLEREFYHWDRIEHKAA